MPINSTIGVWAKRDFKEQKYIPFLFGRQFVGADRIAGARR
jgi:hypothetical protein